ncbi:MAG: hypothetical protein JSS69_17850, partial [Acidobacteria bacterium]|nr:hypothetical protein [Acidobacteriota bacterium]
LELALGTEAVVQGALDLEFRPLSGIPKPVVSARLERDRAPDRLEQAAPPRHAGRFMQQARRACGVSFREASARTRAIARELGDRRYYCSPGALSDYETRTSAPRHIHKLISICSVYFASPTALLQACGAPIEKAGTVALPSEFVKKSSAPSGTQGRPSRFLREMNRRLGPLPWFLCRSAAALFGLPGVSLRDLFWVGQSPRLKHSCLSGAQFLVVDRRQKRPKASLSCPAWAQPIYVLQMRGGSYLWGFCRLDNGTLILYGLEHRARSLRLRNRVDAEVIGRVVGMIRKLA